jgi:hypothetical protein
MGGLPMTDKQYASFLVDRIVENMRLMALALSEESVKTAAGLQDIVDAFTNKPFSGNLTAVCRHFILFGIDKMKLTYTLADTADYGGQA